MLIKTITCHKVYNYGATLQQYALLTFLNNSGAKAETINYTPDYLSGKFNFFTVSNQKYKANKLDKITYLLAKMPSRILLLKRRKKFDIFEEKFIPTTVNNYKTNEDLKKNLPEANVFICGSDQIWNSYFQNGRDASFYLDFVPDDKLKIAYAASFATDTIKEDIKDFVKEKVQRINRISVRETSALKILNELGISNVTQVLDPVFLLDKKHWMQFIRPFPNDFILVYDFDSNPLVKEMALGYKSKYNVSIYTVNKNIDYADRNFYLEGPEIFLSLTCYAQFVFTNSFHAVAFSLIFEKEFAVFERNEPINNRMRDLLALFDLNYLLKTEKNCSANIDIDYNSIRKKMNSLIHTSKNFLIDSVHQR